jgi:glycerol-3-phosphate O-acyltransferase/dihydroxyacetone phosphate acyltransferase
VQINKCMDSITGRRVCFLAAAATLRRPFVGKLSKGFRCIPVERAQDLTRPGTGIIDIEDSDLIDSTVVRGRLVCQ